jgi:hyperosmotically inducible protein
MKPFITIIAIMVVFHLNHRDTWPFPVSGHTPVLQVQNPQAQLLSKKETDADGPSSESGKILQSPNLTLKLAFMADTRLFPYDIECHIQEKTIELRGVVALEEEKALASLLTENLMMGKDILNNIEVQPSLSAKIQVTSDTRLTDLVKQRFANSQTLRETNFEVVTLRGVVSLRGQTRFQVIALEAAQAAREIPGVIAVNTQNVRLGAEHD